MEPGGISKVKKYRGVPLSPHVFTSKHQATSGEATFLRAARWNEKEKRKSEYRER
jgi:hypothetical protein